MLSAGELIALKCNMGFDIKINDFNIITRIFKLIKSCDNPAEIIC